MSITFTGIADPNITLVIEDKHIISYKRPSFKREEVQVESFNNISTYTKTVLSDVVLCIDSNAPQIERLIGLQIARQMSCFEQTTVENIPVFSEYKFSVFSDFEFDEGKVTDTLQGCFLSNVNWLDLSLLNPTQTIELTLRYDNYTS